jgi:hypothetical protein
MAKELIHLFESMEQEIVKGGGKDENTQPYKTYEGWLSEIEGYIQRVVSGKGVKQMNMNNFSRKDYEVGRERNNQINKGQIESSYLEKKTREERLASIITNQTDSNNKSKSRGRGKGKWLI